MGSKLCGVRACVAGRDADSGHLSRLIVQMARRAVGLTWRCHVGHPSGGREPRPVRVVSSRVGGGVGLPGGLPAPPSATLSGMPADFPTYGEKTLPDGRIVLLVPMTFGKVRLTVGTDYMQYEDGW